MLRAFVVPHAPLLVEIPGRPHPAPEIRGSMAALQVTRPVVLVTPHAPRAGVYRPGPGDLAAFGLESPAVDIRGDGELATRIGDAWREPVLEDPPDHGAVVPALLMEGLAGAVVCGLPEWTAARDGGPRAALAAAGSLAAALRKVSAETDIDVVVSAHTSAAISARAPLTESPEGRKVDGLVVDALRADVGRLKEIPVDLWVAAGSCGAGAFGFLGELTSGPMDVVHHSAPFGVGYVVARPAA